MLRKNYSNQRKNLCTKLLKNSKISYFENFDTKKLQITEVFKGLSYYYLLKIHQKVKKLTSLIMVKPYPARRSSMRHLINFFSNAVPTLSIQKPKSFPMANNILDPIMSVIKSFDKHPSTVKIKTKALD